MPKSKQSRSKKVVDVLDEFRPAPPTMEEFRRLKHYKTFVVTSDEGIDFTFAKDQVVLILPHGSDPKAQHELWTYWVARIKEIRGKEYEDGSNFIWVHVQWYYSGKDVSDVIKSFDAKAVGSFERIFSDHFDFIQPEAFDKTIPMYKLNEQNHEQMYIPRDAFYRRYTFEYLARTLSPKPVKSCLCMKPYNPNDTDPQSLMHFCPRPSCRKGYHHGCLLSAKSKESSRAMKTSMTVKIPDYSGSHDGSEKDGGTIRVVRSARKHAAPVKKSSARLRNLKAKEMERVEEDEAEVVRSVVPISGSGLSDRRTTSGAANVERRRQHDPLSGRALRLLGCSPDTDENIDLEALIPPELSEDDMDDEDSEREGDSDEEESEEDGVATRGKRRGPGKKGKSFKGKKKARMRTEAPTLESVLASIPPDLLTIAAQPLVRGGAFVNGGVAGNIGMVTHARRFVHTALQMGGRKGAVMRGWEDVVFGEDRKVVGIGLKNAVVEVEGSVKGKELPPFVCPSCKSAI